MSLHFFKRSGLFFIPITFFGWFVLLTAIAYSIYIFNDIDGRSHSVSDTLINFVFNLIIIGIAYSLFALLTSKNSKK